MMRDLERTPVLSPDVVVLSERQKSRVRRLAGRLGPRAQAIENRWRRRLAKIAGDDLDGPRLRALASINPGSWSELLAKGEVGQFLEQVEYHGRRLAKLDVPPDDVLASLEEYEEALLPDLKRFYPSQFTDYIAALDHLLFLRQADLE